MTLQTSKKSEPERMSKHDFMRMVVQVFIAALMFAVSSMCIEVATQNLSYALAVLYFGFGLILLVILR